MSVRSGTLHVVIGLGLDDAGAMLNRLTTRGSRQCVSVVCLTTDGPVGEQIAEGEILVPLGPKRARSDMMWQRCPSRRSDYTGDKPIVIPQRGDMPTITAKANVGVDAGLSEGFRDAVVEAVACAVPGNAAALAAPMLRLLVPPPKERARPGRATRQRLAEHFETGDVASRSETGYSTITKGRS